MRIKININDQLLAEAMQLTGICTEREVVESGLRLMIQLKRQEQIRASRGNLDWDGNLDELRQPR